MSVSNVQNGAGIGISNAEMPKTTAATAEELVSGLTSNGYAIAKRALDTDYIAGLEADLHHDFAATPYCKGDFYGARTKRFGGLLARSPLVDELVRHPVILMAAEKVLKPYCDRIALNLTQAVEIHSGALSQFPHRDQDMWQGVKGQTEYLLNVIWPLSPFTADNGATRVWPCSHHRQDVAALPDDQSIAAEIMPGDALLFLGSTLHGGGANMTDTPRRGIIISYCLGWLKPFELQWLVYPPHIAKQFDRELAALIGYAQHRPNLGNVEGQCPSKLLSDETPRYRAAIDALAPQQNDALAEFVAGQTRDAEN